MYNIIVLVIFIFSMFLSPKQSETKEVKILKWKKCIETIIDNFNEKVAKTPHSYAYMAYVSAKLYGFKDSSFTRYYNKLEEFYHNNKLLGLGYEWDAFGDNTINTDTTIYTVTVADHIGMPYLEFWKSGFLPKKRITELIDIILDLPLIKDNKVGICVAYSNNYNDTCGCVHNVNAGVAFFLQKAINYNINYRTKECRYLIKNIVTREVSSYVVEKKNWLYWDRKKIMSDYSHTGYEIDAFMNLTKETRKIGLIAGKNLFENRKDAKFSSLNGCIRILPYFSEYEDSMLCDIYIFIENKENNNPRQLAQLAFWCTNYYLYLLSKSN